MGIGIVSISLGALSCRLACCRTLKEVEDEDSPFQALSDVGFNVKDFYKGQLQPAEPSTLLGEVYYFRDQRREKLSEVQESNNAMSQNLLHGMP